MSTPAMLSGPDLVLVARVPRAGDRWQQVHFNQKVAEEFFRLKIGDNKMALLERIDASGRIGGRVKRPLVYSEHNRNCKLEFDFPQHSYPTTGVPLLLVAELGLRSFRYRSLFPADSGYQEMWELTEELPTVGRGLRRVITNLDEIELRWAGSRLRDPLSDIEEARPADPV